MRGYFSLCLPPAIPSMCALLSAILADLLGPNVMGIGLLGWSALNFCASAVSFVIASEIDTRFTCLLLTFISLGELFGGPGVWSGESSSAVVSIEAS